MTEIMVNFLRGFLVGLSLSVVLFSFIVLQISQKGQGDNECPNCVLSCGSLSCEEEKTEKTIPKIYFNFDSELISIYDTDGYPLNFANNIFIKLPEGDNQHLSIKLNHKLISSMNKSIICVEYDKLQEVFINKEPFREHFSAPSPYDYRLKTSGDQIKCYDLTTNLFMGSYLQIAQAYSDPPLNSTLTISFW